MTAYIEAGAPPLEAFPPWELAQREAAALAREPLPAPWELRRTAQLTPELAQRVADWFTGAPTAPAAAVPASYHTLQHETGPLWQMIRRVLGVRVVYTH